MIKQAIMVFAIYVFIFTFTLIKIIIKNNKAPRESIIVLMCVSATYIVFEIFERFKIL